MTVTQLIHSCNTKLLSQLHLSRAGVPWFPSGAMVMLTVTFAWFTKFGRFQEK